MDNDSAAMQGVEWWWRYALVCTLLLVGLGCEDRCNHGWEPPEGTAGAYALAEVVPEDVDFIAFSAHLGDLIVAVEDLDGAVPVDLRSTGKKSSWEAAGAKMDGPALAFLADGQFTVVAYVDPESEGSVEAWSIDGEREDSDKGWHQTDGGQWNRWVGTDGRRIAAGWSPGDGGSQLSEKIWELDEDHWQVDAHQRRLMTDEGVEDGTSGVAHGALDGKILVADFGGEGRAAFIRDQLADQIGTVYWKVEPGDGGSWRLQLYTPGRPELPVAVSDLGQARGALPDIGGLARPGVPAVIRLSAEPEQLIEMLRSTLDVDERQRLDESLSALRNELIVDLEDDVIANIKGQVAVVIFGLEDAFFESQGLELMGALTRLEATREALVVPFEDREAIEEVLNAMTQLSQGKLRREAVGHTIQYAWFDAGALEWAVILSDEHLAIVDSMVAFDHVGNWERSPRSMDESLVERGVDDMLGLERGLGAYLDAATVRSILREGGAVEMASWLEPVDALRVITDLDGRQDMAEVVIWPTDRGGQGEE